MSGTALALAEPVARAAEPAGTATGHVFGARPAPGGLAGALAAVIDPAFLAEAGWDADLLVLRPPAAHPLLGRPVCRAPGCQTTAPASTRICQSCQRRLAAAGLEPERVGSLTPRPYPVRGPGRCAVGGCGREQVSAPAGLCRAHDDQREEMAVSTSEFLAHPSVRPLPACGPCAVAACPRQRRHPDGMYCDAHQMRLRAARGADPGFDQQHWRATGNAIGTGGQVSLRGLPLLVIAEALAGLQRRCRVDTVKTKEAELRAVCDDLRRQQVASIAGYRIEPGRSLAFKGLTRSLAAHSSRALAGPETEIRGDVWDLSLFGHRGRLDFTGISQRWLRETAKRWAADDLPKRRINPGRITSGGLALRHHIGCLTRLSQSLRMRPDRGEHPAGLGRAGMEAFLQRLAYLHSAGQISGDARIRACREVKHVLTQARLMGLTRPGGPAAGLG